MNVLASCKLNQKEAVMALLQASEGKSGSELEHVHCAALPGFEEGHVTGDYGWKVDLPCMEGGPWKHKESERKRHCM